MKSTIILNKILAIRHVACEFKPGVYLSSAEDMTDDQLKWDDDDPGKNTDFSTSAFWITTDNGVDPIGIDSDKELFEMLPDLLVVKKKSDTYVDAIRKRGSGYDVHLSVSNITGFTLTQVNANIVEKMFGHDLDYLLTCSLSSFERFRPLDDGELLDLKKYQNDY